jgi:CubicO group peptidase (beta-lactamase class C family)
MNTMRWSLILVAGLGCSKSQPAAVPEPTQPAVTQPAVPASPWRTATYPAATWDKVPNPEAAGYRSGALDSLTSYLKSIPTTGMVVTVYGRQLYAYGDVMEQSYLASARKSVLSMLYGNYVAQGRIKLDATLAELGIDDRPPLNGEEKKATVRDLLITSSGVYHEASNPGDNLGDAPPRGSQKAGAYFLYSNWDFNVLGTIFEKASQRNIYDAVEIDLARPIGMQDWRRDLQQKSGDTTRSIHPAYHMTFSTRDMARLGYLMLREGKWNDRQVIPAAWVRESTSPLVTSNQMNPPSVRENKLGYGYLWWILEEPSSSILSGSYSARGAFGQYIMVVPKLDMVIAHKRALRQGRENTNVTWSQFMEAVRQVVGARCARECATAN